MIKDVLVLGAGSAGLIAAISLRLKIPQLSVRIVRSPDIGVIGVGEGTTPNFPKHLFDYLRISRKHFYALAQFDYGFGQAMDSHWTDLPRPNGYYCDDEYRCIDLPTALMAHDKAFAR